MHIPFSYLKTLDNRIKIESYSDLAKIGVDDDYPLDGDYIQTADITQDIIEHIVIGDFGGSYDGDCYFINDINITDDNTSDWIGIFRKIEDTAIMKNIMINNCNIQKDSFNHIIGTLAAFNAGSSENILVVNSDIAVNANYCGGLYGYQSGNSNNIQTYNCNILNNIYQYTPYSSNYYTYTGGIYGVSVNIDSNSYNIFSGDVSYGSSFDDCIVGGIAGMIGNAYNSATISKYFSNANLTSGTELGAIIGMNISSCYNSDCFFDSENYSSSPIGTGLTTLESYDKSSFTNWDISYKSEDLDTVIRIDDIGLNEDGTFLNSGYPYLKVFEDKLKTYIKS